MGLFSSVMASIEAYTGLSPAAFFTIGVLMLTTYKIVCSLFVDPEELNEKKHGDANVSPVQPIPIQEPVQLGDVTEQELRAYDGSDPNKPLLMAIKGQIYDVSRSRMFYGPGGPYALFAGREASRALALMSFDPRDLTADLEGLSESELEVLQDWEYKFIEKYVKVGQIVPKKSLAQQRSEDGGEGKKEERSLIPDQQ